MNEKTELAVQEEVPAEILRPIGTPDQLVEAFKVLQEVKRKLITDDDLYPDDRGVQRLRISGWRKLAIAFGLTIKATSEDRLPNLEDRNEWVSRVALQVSARGGRSVVGIGYFSSKEIAHTLDKTGSWVHPTKNDKHGNPIMVPLEHLVASRAYTRALKRAVQDMLGPVEQEEEELGEPEISTKIQEDSSHLDRKVQGSRPEPPAPKAPTPTPPSSRSPAAAGQQRVDSGQRAIAVRFLEDVLGDDLVDLIKLEEKDGELLVILEAPMAEANRTRFLKGMMSFGQGVHESSRGLIARMKAPKR